MDELAEAPDKKPRRTRGPEIIEIGDQDMLDLARSREVEPSVLEILDGPSRN